MSLLLDALKKAAEQKAQKSQPEAPERKASDETLIRAGADSVSGLDEGETGKRETARDDETELDHSEIRNRLESDLSRRIAGDETGFEIADTTGPRPGSIAGDDTRLDIADATESRPESAVTRPDTDDETGLDIADATESRPESAVTRPDTDDETGLDIADATESRPESAVTRPDTDDETGLDIADATESRPESAVTRPDTDDETGLDIADVTESRPESAATRPDTNDETALDVAEVAEFTETAPRPVASDSGAADDTGLDIADVTESRPEAGRHAAADDTALDIANTTETRAAELSQQMQTGDDETIYLADDDSTDLAEEPDADTDAKPAGDQTDSSQPSAKADEIESDLPQRGHEVGEPGAGGADGEAVARDADEEQDLSLLLVDQTDTSAITSLTDPGLPPGMARLKEGDDNTLDGLRLAETDDHDNTEERTDTESTAVTSPTQALGSADDNRQESGTLTQSTLTRAEATSTRTYAPDNYDRTLMRPPDNDASNIFAGMKSESDVVMTPDYAKKVFHSKISAQRLQHYKIYGGIVIVVLLAISIFGAFRYQDEAYEIDTSLRALKRDPMPGIITTAKPEESDLFTVDPDSSARTLEIIETANQDAAAAETDAAAEPMTDASPAEADGAETEVASAPPVETQATPVESPQTGAVEEETAEVAVSTPAVAPAAETVDSAANLHIESSSQVGESDIWLHEAYGAYQSGNYARAMELYNQVLEVDPDNRNALLARAAINIHEGYAEVAIRDYRRLLLANPKDSLAMSSLLTVASYTPEETETQLKLMIREEPESPYLNFALANAYGAQNRWKEAQGHYFKALQNNPNDPNYAYNLAVSLEHISQPVSAITYYRRALENFENGLATFSRKVVDERLQLLGKL